MLIIFQAMDGAGKDAAIKHIFSSFDPQGSKMRMFKAQTAEELKHDDLWRAACSMPARGQIGIFNRLYYERVIVDRVRPEKLMQQKLPSNKTEADVWARCYQHINNFEAYLFDNGIQI